MHFYGIRGYPMTLRRKVYSLQQLWDKKPHRGGPKLSQVENGDRPTMITTPLDRPHGKFLYNLRSAYINHVSNVTVADHSTALLAASRPIHFF